MYNRGMYKDKEVRKQASKERMRKMREGVTSGVTKAEGVTGVKAAGVTDDMMDKLTSDFWRGRLTKICNAFNESSHPDYMLDVWLGDYNMAQVCELLEVTNGKV